MHLVGHLLNNQILNCCLKFLPERCILKITNTGFRKQKIKMVIRILTNHQFIWTQDPYLCLGKIKSEALEIKLVLLSKLVISVDIISVFQPSALPRLLFHWFISVFGFMTFSLIYNLSSAKSDVPHIYV